MKKQKKTTETPKTLRRYRVQFDFTYQGDPGIELSGESETVPDMNLSVRQLLENHTRGLDSNVQTKQPLYFETTVPTLRDITEVDTYRKHLEQKLKETKEFIVKEQKEKAQALKAEKEKKQTSILDKDQQQG